MNRLVLATVNAPYKRVIDAATLQECLANAALGDWRVHIATFFTDVTPDLVFDFASSHGISRSKLAKTYSIVRSTTGERNPALEAELVPLARSSR